MTRAQKFAQTLKLRHYEVIKRRRAAVCDTVSGGSHALGERPGGRSARGCTSSSRVCSSGSRKAERRSGRHVWDVGLGAAANAMAAVHAVEALPAETVKPGLVMVSFGRTISINCGSRCGIPLWFRHLHTARSHELKNLWTNAAGTIEWSLLPGDFTRGASTRRRRRTSCSSIRSRSGTDKRSRDARLFRQPRSQCGKAMSCSTYTAYSTQVRAAMLGGGGFSGEGAARPDQKQETTIGCHRSRWLARRADRHGSLRWERSDTQAPLGVASEGDETWRAAVREHPQPLPACND